MKVLRKFTSSSVDEASFFIERFSGFSNCFCSHPRHIFLIFQFASEMWRSVESWREYGWFRVLWEFGV
jgi:hypothetical protein